MTLIELLISTSITLAITAAALALAAPAQRTVRTELEIVDISQRLRATLDVLTRDVMMAGSGLPAGVAPFATYINGADQGLTVRFVAAPGEAVTAHSYYVLTDTSELRRWNGTTDVPVVDHLQQLAFTCLTGAGALMPCDEPRGVGRVRISLRLQAAASYMRGPAGLLRVPESAIAIDVTPRIRANAD